MDRAQTLGIAEIEERFREITLLMYDTRVSHSVLEARVLPHLAPDIEFRDPWLIAHGRRKFEVGLRGFHCVIHFDFDIHQLGAHLDERGDRGRVIVDGVMNLRQLRFYTYPLRTILVYEFVLDERGGFTITKLEEMWSYGDMIANAPLLVGAFYDRVFRPAAGYFFTAFFWLSCAIARPREIKARGAAHRRALRS